MANQFSVTLRNAQLDVYESTIGASAVLKIRTGSQPATCATADSGTVLATITLPADWMAAAASGAKAMSGTWSDASADATGTAEHFRIYASDGTTCHHQGSVTATGNGGNMTFASVAFTAGQVINVTSFSLAAGNA